MPWYAEAERVREQLEGAGAGRIVLVWCCSKRDALPCSPHRWDTLLHTAAAVVTAVVAVTTLHPNAFGQHTHRCGRCQSRCGNSDNAPGELGGLRRRRTGRSNLMLHGFNDGDRVVRTTGPTGTGTVRVFALTPADRADGCAEGEIAWDDSFVCDELDEDMARLLRHA